VVKISPTLTPSASLAWAGPIVMNRREELSLAREELSNGTFIKHG